MIRSVLTMKSKPGRESEIVELFKREGVFTEALSVAGCNDVTMLIREGEVLVTATWIDAEAYDAWINHPNRNSNSEELNRLLDSPMTPDIVAVLYEVALESSDVVGA